MSFQMPIRRFTAILLTAALLVDPAFAQARRIPDPQLSNIGVLMNAEALTQRDLFNGQFRASFDYVKSQAAEINRRLSEMLPGWFEDHFDFVVLGGAVAVLALSAVIGVVVPRESVVNAALVSAGLGAGVLGTAVQLICRSPRSDEFYRLTSSLQKLVEEAPGQVAEAERSGLTQEQIVDTAYQTDLFKAADLGQLREGLQTFLRALLAPNQADAELPAIYFVVPGEEEPLFASGGQRSAVHYTVEPRALYFSIPALEKLYEIAEDFDAALQELALHGWKHLNDPGRTAGKRQPCDLGENEKRLYEAFGLEPAAPGETVEPALTPAERKAILKIVQDEGVTLPPKRLPRWMGDAYQVITLYEQNQEERGWFERQITGLYQEHAVAVAATDSLEGWYRDLVAEVIAPALADKGVTISGTSSFEGRITRELWFKAVVFALAQIEAHNQGIPAPSSFEEARSQAYGWAPLRMTYHPFVKTRCAFNHPIEWAFHWVHVPTRTRIVLGQDEVVTLKLMTKAEKEAWLGAHLEGNRRANSLYPQAGVCLSLARDLDVLKALLAEPEFARKGHGSLRAQLLAMARIAASHQTLGSIPLVGQPIHYTGGITQIKAEAIDQTIDVARRLVRRGLEMRRRWSIPTRLQVIVSRAAIAQAWVRKGDFSAWDLLMPLYSKYVEQLGAFWSRMAVWGRFAGLVASPWRRGGKPMDQINLVVSYGGGPAITARALHRNQKRLKEKGFDLNKVTVVNVDQSRVALALGEQVMSGRRTSEKRPVAMKSIQAQVGSAEPIRGIQDGTVDVAESGLVGSLDVDQKINFLGEVNRGLGEQGYLVLTSKRAIPKEFRAALPEFGFKVMTERDAKLFYSQSTRHGLAGGRIGVMNRIRERLSGMSYLVAVKVNNLETGRLGELRGETRIRDAMRFQDDGTGEEGAEGDEDMERAQPTEMPVTGIRWRAMGDDALESTGITREEMLAEGSPYKNFEAHLACLLWIQDEYLTPNEVLKLQSIIAMWDDPAEEVLARRQVKWVMDRVQRAPRRPSQTEGPDEKKKTEPPGPDDKVPPPTEGAAATARTQGTKIWDLFLKEESRRQTFREPSLVDVLRANRPDLAAEMPVEEEAVPEPVVPIPLLEEIIPELPQGRQQEPAAVPGGTDELESTGGLPIVIEVRPPQAAPEETRPKAPPVDPRIEAVVQAIRQKNTNKAMNNRVNPALVRDIASAARRARDEEGRVREIRELLKNRKIPLNGISPKEILDLLLLHELLESIVVEIQPPALAAESPAPSAPGASPGAASPGQPRSAPLPGAPSAPSAAPPTDGHKEPLKDDSPVLVNMAETLRIAFNSGFLDSKSWEQRQKDLAESVGPITPEIVDWAEKASDQSPLDPQARRNALDRFCEALNQTYLYRRGFLLMPLPGTQENKVFWKVEIESINRASSKEYKIILPATSGLPEEQRTTFVHMSPREQKYAHLGHMVGMVQVGVLGWERTLGVNFNAAFKRLGEQALKNPLMKSWVSRMWGESRVDPIAIIHKIASNEACQHMVGLVAQMQGRRLLETHQVSSVELHRHVDEERAFIEKYLDKDGDLFSVYHDERLQRKLRNTSASAVHWMMDLFDMLHEVRYAPNASEDLGGIVCKAIEGNQSTQLIFAWLMHSYLSPGEAVSLERFLGDKNKFVPELGQQLLSFTNTQITDAMDAILDDNFRAAVVFDKGTIRFEERPNPWAHAIPPRLGREIAKFIQSSIDAGKMDRAQFDSLIRHLASRGPVPDAVAHPDPALFEPLDGPRKMRERQLFAYVRTLNDLYAGPRGTLFDVVIYETAGPPKQYHHSDMFRVFPTKKTDYRMEGIITDAIPGYEIARIPAGLAKVYNTPATYSATLGVIMIQSNFDERLKDIQQVVRVQNSMQPAGDDARFGQTSKRLIARSYPKGPDLSDLKQRLRTRDLTSALISAAVDRLGEENGRDHPEAARRWGGEEDLKVGTLNTALFEPHITESGPVREAAADDHFLRADFHRNELMVNGYHVLSTMAELTGEPLGRLYHIMSSQLMYLLGKKDGKDNQNLHQTERDRVLAAYLLLRGRPGYESLTFDSMFEKWEDLTQLYDVSQSLLDISSKEAHEALDEILNDSADVRIRLKPGNVISVERSPQKERPVSKEVVIEQLRSFIQEAFENNARMTRDQWLDLKKRLKGIGKITPAIDQAAREVCDLSASPRGYQRHVAFFGFVKALNDDLLVDYRQRIRVYQAPPKGSQPVSLLPDSEKSVEYSLILPSGQTLTFHQHFANTPLSLDAAVHSGLLINKVEVKTKQDAYFAYYQSALKVRNQMLQASNALSHADRWLYYASLGHVDGLTPEDTINAVFEEMVDHGVTFVSVKHAGLELYRKAQGTRRAFLDKYSNDRDDGNVLAFITEYVYPDRWESLLAEYQTATLGRSAPAHLASGLHHLYCDLTTIALMTNPAKHLAQIMQHSINNASDENLLIFWLMAQKLGLQMPTLSQFSSNKSGTGEALIAELSERLHALIVSDGEESLRYLMDSILNDYFRVSVTFDFDGAKRTIQLVERPADRLAPIPPRLERVVRRFFEDSFKTGRFDAERFEQLARYMKWSLGAMPAEVLAEATKLKKWDGPAITDERREELAHFLRILNDVYLGPRGLVLFSEHFDPARIDIHFIRLKKDFHPYQVAWRPELNFNEYEFVDRDEVAKSYLEIQARRGIIGVVLDPEQIRRNLKGLLQKATMGAIAKKVERWMTIAFNGKVGSSPAEFEAQVRRELPQWRVEAITSMMVQQSVPLAGDGWAIPVSFVDQFMRRSSPEWKMYEAASSSEDKERRAMILMQFFETVNTIIQIKNPKSYLACKTVLPILLDAGQEQMPIWKFAVRRLVQEITHPNQDASSFPDLFRESPMILSDIDFLSERENQEIAAAAKRIRDRAYKIGFKIDLDEKKVFIEHNSNEGAAVSESRSYLGGVILATATTAATLALGLMVGHNRQLADAFGLIATAIAVIAYAGVSNGLLFWQGSSIKKAQDRAHGIRGPDLARRTFQLAQLKSRLEAAHNITIVDESDIDLSRHSGESRNPVAVNVLGPGFRRGDVKKDIAFVVPSEAAQRIVHIDLLAFSMLPEALQESILARHEMAHLLGYKDLAAYALQAVTLPWDWIKHRAGLHLLSFSLPRAA